MNSPRAREVPDPVKVSIGALYRGLMADGGTRRKGQQIMIGKVAEATCNAKREGEVGTGDRLLAVQAPTGSGKTLGYAVGAIPAALAAGLKVVISSATVQLQEQIIGQDLVAVGKHLPEMKTVLVKGRARYLCLVRAEEEMQAGHGEGGGAGELAAKLLERMRGGWDGDVDGLEEQPDAMLWGRMTNDRNGCAGRRCSKYDDCPFYKVRRQIEDSNVTVVNHDLLIADVMGGNHILPAMKDSVLLIDEAHELAPKALAAQESRIWIEKAKVGVQKALRAMGKMLGDGAAKAISLKAAEVCSALETVWACLEETRPALESTGKFTASRDPKRSHRFAKGVLPAWLAEIAETGAESGKKASDGLVELCEMLTGEEGDGMPDKRRERMVSDVARTTKEIDEIAALWNLMRRDERNGASGPTAKWIEVDEAEGDLCLCASPVEVGDVLHKLLWSECAAAVSVSATLTTVGGFKKYLKDSGLAYTEGVRTLEVASPFDYEKQAALTVPLGIRNPRNAEEHTADLIARLSRTLSAQAAGTGALVLFASWKQLKDVADAMPDSVKANMLLQGNGVSKREVIRLHKQAIDQGRRSFIFGTQSFEQGVDLPGDYLKFLTVAKLQFAVPTSPIVEAHREHMEGQGLSYFDEVVVPETYNRLAQSVGRLLRTEKDSGRVEVVDPRLTQTKYGKAMLKALPPFRMEHDWSPDACEMAAEERMVVGHEMTACEDWSGIQGRPF